MAAGRRRRSRSRPSPPLRLASSNSCGGESAPTRSALLLFLALVVAVVLDRLLERAPLRLLGSLAPLVLVRVAHASLRRRPPGECFLRRRHRGFQCGNTLAELRVTCAGA